jgi:hypothetical protein
VSQRDQPRFYRPDERGFDQGDVNGDQAEEVNKLLPKKSAGILFSQRFFSRNFNTKVLIAMRDKFL